MSSGAVWALILAAGRIRLDPASRERLRLTCGGWWLGWLSATIARASYPPPKPLDPEVERQLAAVSLALVALGLGSTARLLWTGGQPSRR